MNCRELTDFLGEYLDGALLASQRRVFDAHLAECADCVAYLESYRETVRLAGSLARDPEGPVPEDAPEALVRAILAARRGS